MVPWHWIFLAESKFHSHYFTILKSSAVIKKSIRRKYAVNRA